jgi:hypothetical protein
VGSAALERKEGEILNLILPTFDIATTRYRVCLGFTWLQSGLGYEVKSPITIELSSQIHPNMAETTAKR